MKREEKVNWIINTIREREGSMLSPSWFNDYTDSALDEEILRFKNLKGESKVSHYVGNWIHPHDLKREITTGDWVMLETLDETVVVEVSKVHDGELWHFNNWVIPRKQIVAVKST